MVSGILEVFSTSSSRSDLRRDQDDSLGYGRGDSAC
jgi:hypothetical protein